MRIRTGWGPDDWTPSVPSAAISARITGSAITSGPGINDRDRANAQDRKSKATRTPKAES